MRVEISQSVRLDGYDTPMHVNAVYDSDNVYDCMKKFRQDVIRMHGYVVLLKDEVKYAEAEFLMKESEGANDRKIHLLRSAHLCYLELSAKGENQTEEEREWVERYKRGGIQAAIRADQVVNFPSCKSDFI